MKERLQKVLSRAGFGSRRACEVIISAKRVKVNGSIALLGSKADVILDDITIDGKPLEQKTINKIYIAFHKPQGVLSENYSSPNCLTVRDYIPLPNYLFIVGRLDKESEGLVLLTNDGDLANELTHPRFEHEKEYKVLINKEPDEKQLSAWRRGIILHDGHRTAPAKVVISKLMHGSCWLNVILHEGRKRQIREVGALLGLPVEKIIRIRIGSLLLGNLKPGQWKNLDLEEINNIKNQHKILDLK